MGVLGELQDFVERVGRRIQELGRKDLPHALGLARHLEGVVEGALRLEATPPPEQTRGDPEEVLTASQVALLIGIKAYHVRRLARENTLASYRVSPRRVGFRRKDVWRYLDEVKRR